MASRAAPECSGLYEQVKDDDRFEIIEKLHKEADALRGKF
jgi:hypothetical protein